jgi:molybdopterin-containing oxidoreductase family iron-sulfur binding subunit
VSRLLILGGNPAYTAPRGLGFAEVLARVAFSAHLSGQRDETSQRCTWHLPAGHEFEQWSDARAFDGTATLLQPVIAPLYDTRSAHELLAWLIDEGTAPVDGHALVRAQWCSQGGAADFEAFWADSLRRGVVAGSAAPALDLPAARLPAAAPAAVVAPAAAVWAVFPLDAAVGDGSHANNGWLQELPRPFTKVSWGNALHLGPATAASLGLHSGDVVPPRSSRRPSGCRPGTPSTRQRCHWAMAGVPRAASATAWVSTPRPCAAPQPARWR